MRKHSSHLTNGRKSLCLQDSSFRIAKLLDSNEAGPKHKGLKRLIGVPVAMMRYTERQA